MVRQIVLPCCVPSSREVAKTDLFLFSIDLNKNTLSQIFITLYFHSVCIFPCLNWKYVVHCSTTHVQPDHGLCKRHKAFYIKITFYNLDLDLIKR